MREVERSDFFGFIQGDLLSYLDFNHAKTFLKDNVTETEWNDSRETKPPLEVAKNYLPFAWEIANNCRGISASRAVNHFEVWLWLAGIEGFHDIADEEYEYYGKPVLVLVSIILDFPWKDHDQGGWVNSEDGPAHEPSADEIQRLTEIAVRLKGELSND
jgi:hypothetical protein